MTLSSKGYLVRMGKKLESNVLSVADQHGVSVPEAMRYLAEKALKSSSYDQRLHDMEVRLLKKNFEICSEVVGLSMSEKEKARKACNDIFEQEVL